MINATNILRDNADLLTELLSYARTPLDASEIKNVVRSQLFLARHAETLDAIGSIDELNLIVELQDGTYAYIRADQGMTGWDCCGVVYIERHATLQDALDDAEASIRWYES